MPHIYTPPSFSTGPQAAGTTQAARLLEAGGGVTEGDGEGRGRGGPQAASRSVYAWVTRGAARGTCATTQRRPTGTAEVAGAPSPARQALAARLGSWLRQAGRMGAAPPLARPAHAGEGASAGLPPGAPRERGVPSEGARTPGVQGSSISGRRPGQGIPARARLLPENWLCLSERRPFYKFLG